MCWKPHLVYLARWVKMGKFCLLCFQVRTLMWRPFFSRSPCYIMIVNVQVLSLVEDECTFNTISFMKNRSEFNLTHIWIYAPNFIANIFLLCKIFVWANHCQVGWQSLLLCRCVSDNINVVGALQSAHLGSKPNLDVLGVTILMSWFMSH